MSPRLRLRSLDTHFIAAETDTAPLHVGGIGIFEGGPLFDENGDFRMEDVRRHIESRLHLIPRFRQRAVTVPLGLGRPVWVDDPEFEIANHVKVAVLPPPGDDDQLLALCADLQTSRLPRDQPLWEFWFISGLAGGRVALFEKVHHAMIDGVSGVEASVALFDLARGWQPAEIPPWVPDAPPGPLELVLGSARDRIEDVGTLVRGLVDGLRSPGRLVSTARRDIEGLLTLVNSKLFAPASSMNEPVGARRFLQVVRRPLDEVRAVGKAHDTTINNVILAAVVGGVARLLEARGDAPVPDELHVAVPVSLRTTDESLTLGNRVAAIVAPLPLGPLDPIGRLREVRRVMDDLRQHHQREAISFLLELEDLLPVGLIAAVSHRIAHQRFVNMVVTNVPGPQVPLYFMGAELLETFAVVPLAGNLTVGVAILSYNGRVAVTVNTDPDRVPDIDLLVRAIDDEFDALTAATSSAG